MPSLIHRGGIADLHHESDEVGVEVAMGVEPVAIGYEVVK
jgi:hypothetical protein